MDHPHFLDFKFLLLQNVMGLVDHLLPGHQKCYLSHSFTSFLKYAATLKRRAAQICLLLLFDILRYRDLLVINMLTDGFLCLCHVSGSDRF